MTFLFPFFSRGEGPQFREPDFDYPAKVATEATELVAKADREPAPEAGRIRLRALVELFAAQTAIDSDSAYTQPAKVASLLEAPNNTPVDRAMLLTLQARLYWRILHNSYWRYSQVVAPLTPLPADVSEWSAAQFEGEISRLLAEALAIPECATTPLGRYSDAVVCDSCALTYLPTVRDFILYQAAVEATDPAKYIDRALAESGAGSPQYFYWAVEQTQQNRSDLADNLYKLYSENTAVEPARYVLARLASTCERSVTVTDRTRQIIDYLTASLRDFPDWYGNSDLKYYLRNLTSPIAEITGPDYVTPGVEFTTNVRYSFTDSITLYLFKRPKSDYIDPAKIVKRYKPEMVKTVDTKTGDNCSVAFSTSCQGQYLLVGKVMDSHGVATYAQYDFESVGFVPLAFSGRNKSCILTLDYTDGKPVSGVGVSMLSNSYSDRNKPPRVVGTTPASGMLELTEHAQYAYLKFDYKGYSTDFNRSINVYSLSERYDNAGEQQRILVLTDRPIYHPGDSLAWSVVLAEKEKGKEAKTLADKDVTVILQNANYQAVDTVQVRTDRFGRAEGSFVIPTGMLSGRYTIRAEYGTRTDGRTSVMVSDFRPPVFYVEVTSIQRDVPEQGAIRIEGRARTFSGMPVADADVYVSLSGSPMWWRFSGQQEVATRNLRTAADGCFTIVFAAETFAEYSQGEERLTDYSANITVTAADASTASTVGRFTLGKPYSLMADLPSTHDTSNALKVTFKAMNADGQGAPLAVQWSLAPVRKGDEQPAPVASGDAVCGTPTDLMLGRVPAGQYTLTLTPADSTLADSFTGSVMVLYNLERNLVPDIPGQSFFIPNNRVTLDATGSAGVHIGVTAPTTIFAVIDDNGNIRSVKSYDLKPGFTEITVQFPKTDEENPYRGMRIVNVSNGNTNIQTVSFVQPVQASPKLAVQTFRNKLTPCATETWTIRLLDASGDAVPSAPAIATMYNRALEDLCSPNWQSAFSFSSPSYQLNYSLLNNYSNYIQIYPSVLRDDRRDITWPYWRFINQISSHKYMMFRSSATLKAEADLLIVEDDAEGVNDLSMAAGAPMANAALTETAATTEAFDTEEEEVATEPEAEFREAEVLQAFWMPSLVADAEGNIDIVFTVPNANATWTFRSLAWTPQAQTGALALEALANKPVMVQPNLPRFLRQCDSARVLATVYNNSGEAATVTTTIELFDATSGAVISTVTSTDSIASDASALVGIDITAPTDRAAVGYRVRSRLGSYSDGEQALIPILSSSATVIESTEFYLNPADSKPFTLRIPAGDDATVTLQYCQNPVWTVVRAMRGLGSGDGLTSTSLVSKLFSALAARSIIAGNPAIATAISEWSSNPDSRALESMLSRNDNLKALLLDQTPWVQTAADQSARMAALANVLSPDRANAAVKEYVEKIVKLQAANGGIRWTSWFGEPSEWATRDMLVTLGIAHSLGMLPTDNQDITELIRSAWAFVCAEAVKPKVPDTDFTLAYISAMLPGLESDATTEKIISRTIANIRSSWKGSSLTTKAYAVLILQANGLSKEAQPIFESIREFAVDRPGMGKCFPNIDDIRSYATIIQAYKAMGAPAAEIDRLRQWVIVQAQATDDLFAYNPDYVIAAVMLTGTDWTSVPIEENVTVDGRRLDIDSIESATGYFAQTLSPGRRPLVVTVTPNGVTPSYGSVISISRRPMATVKARPGRDLSIEKRVLVEREGRWVETSDFTLGERLRIQLIIKAKRALDYVTIDDERPAAFEPVEQLPGYVYADGLGFYRENLDASTRLFIGHMPAGTYLLTYDMTANVAGSFISGIATLQSQYAPELTAHSSAATIKVK